MVFTRISFPPIGKTTIQGTRLDRACYESTSPSRMGQNHPRGPLSVLYTTPVTLAVRATSTETRTSKERGVSGAHTNIGIPHSYKIPRGAPRVVVQSAAKRQFAVQENQVDRVEIGSGKDSTVRTALNLPCASRGLEKRMHCRLRRS